MIARLRPVLGNVELPEVDSRIRLIALLAPLLAVFGLLFVVPVGRLLAQAFYLDGTFTLEHFRTIAEGTRYRNVVIRTVRISAMTTLITMSLGYTLAYYIVFKSERKRLLLLLVFVTMVVDLVVRVFGWLIALSSDSLIEVAFSPIFGDLSILFTERAVVIGLVQFTLPFMIFVSVAILSTIDSSLIQAARNLGASRLEAFVYVTVPLSTNAIIVGGGLVFALSMSSFVSPQLLGGGQNQMLANTIYTLVSQTGQDSLAAALGLVLLSVTALLLSVFVLVVSRLGGDRS